MFKHAKSKFDDLAKTKCPPLFAEIEQHKIKAHKLPATSADVEDDGTFRLVVLGADYAGVTGDPPKPGAVDYIRTHSSPTDIHVASGSSRIDSLKHDGKKALIIKQTPGGAEKLPERAFGGRRRTNMVTLNIADVQTLGDEIHQITKLLAGCDPVIEACISIKPKPGMDTKEIDDVLNKIKKEWKF